MSASISPRDDRTFEKNNMAGNTQHCTIRFYHKSKIVKTKLAIFILALKNIYIL